MEDQLVKFETAIFAKEKGFNIPTLYFYLDGSLRYNHSIKLRNSNTLPGTIDVSAPTQSLLQKWLRDVHNIDIQITLVKAGYNEYKVEIYKRPENTNEYTYFFIKEEDCVYIKYFHTYEEALEEGLQEALKLIK